VPPPPDQPYGAPPSYISGATPYGEEPATRGLSNNALLGLIAVGVLVVSALGYLLLSGGSDDEDASTDEAPTETIETSSTVPAPALAAGAPATVTLEADSADDPRVHPLSMGAGQTGTVVVEGQGAFTPVVALLDPNGDEVAAQGVITGPRGAAVNVTAAEGGEYALLVSGFTEGLSGYTVTFRPDETFSTPSQLAVGDCVDRLEGEQWTGVSGFFLADCGQPHEGQVFEQAPGNTASGQAAHEQCDVARGQRILLPGYVAWYAYWGEGLTCVVVNRTGGALTSSIVSN